MLSIISDGKTGQERSGLGGMATFRLSSMLRDTAVCREVKGTVVPRSSDTVVPADLAAAAMAGAGAGAALGGAAAAGAAAAGAGAALGPAQQHSAIRTSLKSARVCKS